METTLNPKHLILLVLLLFGYQLKADPPDYTISGYIKDASNGETLIGATMYVKELKKGTQTNVYGFYSLTLPPGTYTIQYRYVGYDDLERTIELTGNQRVDIELTEQKVQLEEVVVTGKPEDYNVTSTEMSVAEIEIKTIQKLPALFGEADVLKSIQLLPGVSTVGEGASGFNVRGGSVGQNLVLLDEAPVYNSSHMLGFFSVFNPDAVKDVKLYKGGIPANYGGRLASILDIRMKEGNMKEYDVSGGVGSVFSRLAVEGPIVKDKASFIVAGRRSYADVFAKLFTDALEDGASLYFYDLTLKTNYNINHRNRIFLSGYLGRDRFMFDKDQGISWGNNTATLRWNHLFNDRLFSNFTAFFSDYDYELAFGENDLDKFEWNSRIRTTTFKPEFTYFINSANELSFGGELFYYRFDPANASVVSNGAVTDMSLDSKYSLEGAIYLSNEQKLSPSISLEYGLRGSYFAYMGPGNYYEFATPEPGERKEVISVAQAGRRETIKDYYNLEPRVSARVQTGAKSSIKASYNRMVQYLHLISNTTASNPLDLWTPSTNNIKPQTGDQYVLGYFHNFGHGNDYETSVEFYYRSTKNQIDYIDGAELLINEKMEADLLSGDGRAYGVELYGKKNSGKIHGWVSYTLGRSELKVDGINNGEWYLTRYDQTHNVKIAAFYDISKRVTITGNFTYLSGTPTTFPTSRYTIGDYLIPYNDYESRNNYRIPDFHRLDLSVTLYGKKYKNGVERKNRDNFVFSLYNVYGRRNPFSIYFTQGTDRPEAGHPIDSKAVRVSIIGTLVPAVSYNFNF